MPGDFTDARAIIKDVFEREKPRSVLEISGFDECLAEFLSDVLYHVHLSENLNYTAKIDRVDLTSSGSLFESRYRNIFNSDIQRITDEISNYDIILIFHLFENLPAIDAKKLLAELLIKTRKSILLFTQMYPYDLESETDLSTVRAYHPVFFTGMEFSYKMIGDMQVYNFFPKINYEKMLCDDLSDFKREAGKLKIAYILPTRAMTGGAKAILQQVKELCSNGHTINLYYRCDESDKAIPEWSHLTDDDVSAQIVIPKNEYFIDYLNDEDIVVLGFVNEVDEFRHSKIPVVLWEQGSPAIFGDLDEILVSSASLRMIMHTLYRLPVHILAVSHVIQDILKGIYNRESSIFPNGIDTDFYYPAEKKDNDIPVVLLVGNPSLKFKGFDFAFSVLEETAKMDVPFKVRWASQIKFTITNTSFDIEYFILPSQEELADLYRTSDVFLSTSLYESFALPPLEAMASGTAVLSTDNGGINTYAKPGENCLLCEQGDLNSMVYALSGLLLSSQARESLSKAGRKTALEYSFKNIIPILEERLNRIVADNNQLITGR